MLIAGIFKEGIEVQDDDLLEETFIDYEKQKQRIEELTNEAGKSYYFDSTVLDLDIPTEHLYMYCLTHVDSDLDNSYFVREVFFEEEKAIALCKEYNEDIYKGVLEGDVECPNDYKQYYNIRYLSVKEIVENIEKRIEDENILEGDNFDEYPFLAQYSTN